MDSRRDVDRADDILDYNSRWASTRKMEHKRHLQSQGGWMIRETARCREEINRLLKELFITRMSTTVSVEEQESIVEAVVLRNLDPYSAVEKLYTQANAI